jgi:tetratricopeptide (TPR) repeat protein
MTHGFRPAFDTHCSLASITRAIVFSLSNSAIGVIMDKMRIRQPFCLAGILLALPALLFAQTDRDLTAGVASALSAKDFDKALVLLQPALKQRPQNAKLWTLQALALSGKGNTKEALIAYQTALKISPDYLPALEGAAQSEYNAGSQNAVPLLNHLLKLRPDDPTTHAMLAVLAARNGDCHQAVEHFLAIGSLLDSEAQLREEYGACLLKLKQPEQAISIYRKPVELNPTDNEARYQLAVVQLMAEKPSDALDTLGPLLQVHEPGTKTLELAASAYEDAGNTKMAVNTLRQAILADPHNVDLYLDFAAISMDHQSFQVGIDMVEVGLKAEPKAAPLYVARGVLYVQLAKYDQAQDDFEKAEQLEPNQPLASVAKGLELAQTNDLTEALRTVRSKLVRTPNDPYLLYLQADILAQSGPEPGSQNFQNALRSARRAVALEPGLVAVRDLLAKLYLQAGQNQSAIAQCREALKSDPKDQTALYHLIQALRKTGDQQELPDLLKRLAELRAESTKQEREHNRYKLVEAGASSTTPQ